MSTEPTEPTLPLLAPCAEPVGADVIGRRVARPGQNWRGRESTRFNTAYALQRARPEDAPGLTRAQRVRVFVESLRLTSGRWAGQFFQLQGWQWRFVQGVYDPVDADGRRVCRTALLSVGRRNGKSTLAAALALAHFCGPEAEQRGQIVLMANSIEQAGRLFAECLAFLQHDPHLWHRTLPRAAARMLEDTITGTTLRVLSPVSEKLQGLDATLVIYDELGHARDRRVLDALETSFGSRLEPLLIIISTQAPSPDHPMSEYVDRAQQIADGALTDPAFVGHVYAAPMEADIWDEATWYLANPALGHNRDLAELRTYAARARQSSSLLGPFRNYYLNQRIDAEAVGLFTSDQWQACAAPLDPLDSLTGAACFGGLDLSESKAMTAFALFFPETGALYLRYWCPGSAIEEREQRYRIPLRAWIAAGLLTPTPGPIVDLARVADDIAATVAPFHLIALAFDRWRITHVRAAWEGRGVVLPLVEHGQGFKDISPSLAAIEARVLTGTLKHGGNAILSYNMSNLAVMTDVAGNRKIDRRRQTSLIDGAIAATMAIGQAARTPIPAVLDPSLFGQVFDLGGAR